MTIRLSAALLIAVLLAACGSTAAPASPSASPAATPSVLPSASTGEPSASPEASAPEGGETISGMLGYEGIEGGCPYVEVADGTRYQVQYPEGYAIDPSSGDLIGPDGAVVVPLGGQIEIRGAVQTDMGSICQIGPIFRAFEVVTS